MDNWPLTLPQKIQVQGFAETQGSSTISSQNDTGPRKLRRRNTKEVEPINGSMLIDFTQRETLKAFYRDTLASGSKPFIFPDPYTGIDTEYIFLGPPKFSALGGQQLVVTMSWETA